MLSVMSVEMAIAMFAVGAFVIAANGMAWFAVMQTRRPASDPIDSIARDIKELEHTIRSNDRLSEGQHQELRQLMLMMGSQVQQIAAIVHRQPTVNVNNTQTDVGTSVSGDVHGDAAHQIHKDDHK